MPQLGLSLSSWNEACGSLILSLPSYNFDAEEVFPRVSEAIQTLWCDLGVKEAVRRSHEYQINDCAAYYFNSVERFSAPGYLPTDKDILQSYVKTTGITETTFRVGELTYKVFDTGGQRSERKKWIHCFENVTAVVSIVSLNEYNLGLYEDESVVCLP
jgi:guanine nucleotide-binding protein G(i) subunit alpha